MLSNWRKATGKEKVTVILMFLCNIVVILDILHKLHII